MKTWQRTIAIATILSVVSVGTAVAQMDPPEVDGIHTQAEEGHASVQLTDEQKQELAALHRDMIDKKKAIIDKYVSFGIMKQDKADKIKSHLDDRYKQLESNGFVPQWDQKEHKRGHRE